MNELIEYEKAIKYAVRYLDELNIQTAGPDNVRQFRFRFAAIAGVAAIDTDGNRLEPDPEYENKSVDELAELFDAPLSCEEQARYRLVLTGDDAAAIEKLIVFSQVSTIAFDALVDIAASMARNGLPYSGMMQEWVADYLEGKISSKARTGRLRAEMLGRDLYVLGAIYELIERGMSDTRNDASAPTPSSKMTNQPVWRKNSSVSPKIRVFQQNPDKAVVRCA